MIGMAETFVDDFKEADFDVTIPEFTQEMSEDSLCEIIGDFDGWIIGDDPATRRVLEAGVQGNLKACMRWGVGTNNVDFAAFEEFQVPIENTPGVFGREVADLACHYVSALARDTYQIDKKVKQGDWYKPIGVSLWSQSALVVGMGDIGKQLAKRLSAHDMKVSFYDPFVKSSDVGYKYQKVTWPQALNHHDFVIFTAPLNADTYHMFNHDVLPMLKPGTFIINVGRGPLIQESALIEGLRNGQIARAALDVFEVEPLSSHMHAELLKHSNKLILGSHNGSNTLHAVKAVSIRCINRLSEFLS